MFAPQVPSISPKKIPDGAFLLDVREDDEWAAGHARGAVHIPMMDIPARMGDIPKGRDVVVICRSGSRSAQVVAYLQDNGWNTVFNLDRGMRAWAAEDRPVDRPDGEPGEVI